MFTADVDRVALSTWLLLQTRLCRRASFHLVVDND